MPAKWPKLCRQRGEIYRDKAGDWRWRVRARNGRILADSAEGYKGEARCRLMCRTVARVCRVVKVDD